MAEIYELWMHWKRDLNQITFQFMVKCKCNFTSKQAGKTNFSWMWIFSIDNTFNQVYVRGTPFSSSCINILHEDIKQVWWTTCQFHYNPQLFIVLTKRLAWLLLSLAFHTVQLLFYMCIFSQLVFFQISDLEMKRN